MNTDKPRRIKYKTSKRVARLNEDGSPAKDANLSQLFDVETTWTEGWFHGFAQESEEGGGGFTVAIIELDDGTLQTPIVHHCQFVNPLSV